MNDAREHESAFVDAFVRRERRDRLRSGLRSAKRRPATVARFDHLRDLDPRRMQSIPPHEHDPDAIGALLRRLGAPAACHVVSANRRLDGRSMELQAALDAIVGSGNGTVVSCRPGQLACFEGEEPGDRWLLVRGV